MAFPPLSGDFKRYCVSPVRIDSQMQRRQQFYRLMFAHVVVSRPRAETSSVSLMIF